VAAVTFVTTDLVSLQAPSAEKAVTLRANMSGNIGPAQVTVTTDPDSTFTDPAKARTTVDMHRMTHCGWVGQTGSHRDTPRCPAQPRPAADMCWHTTMLCCRGQHEGHTRT
jgi:hypothetical protein